ncbi:MAG: hypothetical protein QOG88_1972 [Actinomycetota bacterium]|nr:hypothetical protein [Actinomycetota bacterium]
MNGSLLNDPFAHHVWATLRLLDSCVEFEHSQLETSVAGTYGSIIDTLRHLVSTDAWYRYRLDGRASEFIDDEGMDLTQLRTVMEEGAEAWPRIIAADIDPQALVMGRADDGTEVWWPAGIRLAQALHHGTDHRSQICTALTSIGLEPPPIDVWDYAEQHGWPVSVASVD